MDWIMATRESYIGGVGPRNLNGNVGNKDLTTTANKNRAVKIKKMVINSKWWEMGRQMSERNKLNTTIVVDNAKSGKC